MIKKILLIIVLCTLVSADIDEMPIAAKAGQCFTKSFYPPTYTKETKIKSNTKVRISDDSVKYDVIPAQYNRYKERIKVSDGNEKIIVEPAVYKTVYERVKIKPSMKNWRKSLSTTSAKVFNSCVQAAKDAGMDVSNAQEGTCFYEHYQPEQYMTTTSKILASEASERIVVTPAKYRTISKKIMTESPTVQLLPSVAIYKTIKEKIKIRPARSEWRKTICNNKGCNQSEVVCLIEIPAVYKEITRRIVLQPAVTKKTSVPAKYKIVKVQELVSPAITKSIVVPAKYKTLSSQKRVEEEKYFWSGASGKDARTRLTSQCNKICLTQTPATYKKVAKKILVKPSTSRKVMSAKKYMTVEIKKITQEASYKKTVIPAEYLTLIIQRERTKGYARWVPMICESLLTPKIIKKVQRALQFQGFYHGEINGVWDIESKSASRAYQKKQGLGITSKLSIETMKSLEIY